MEPFSKLHYPGEWTFHWERQMKQWEVDPQLNSLFFSKLPPELREEIYRQALEFQETPWDHDFRVKYDHDPVGLEDEDIREDLRVAQPIKGSMVPWQSDDKRRPIFDEDEVPHRPDLPRRRERHTNLLLSCRRIFMEARKIMLSREVFRKDHFDCREGFEDPERCSGNCHLRPWLCTERNHFNDWCRDQKAFQRELTRIRALSYEPSLQEMMRLADLTRLEHLRFTSNNALPGFESILADASFPMHPLMRPDPSDRSNRIFWYDHNRRDVDDMDPKKRTWGRETVNMPAIRTLTIDFDTYAYRSEQLVALVEEARRTWRFPLDPETHHDGCHYLSAEGNTPRKMSWRAGWDQWPYYCPKCNANYNWRPRPPPSVPYDDPIFGVDCGSHAAMTEMIKKGFGPRYCSITLTFTPRKCTEGDVREGFCAKGKKGMYCGGFETAYWDVANGEEDPLGPDFAIQRFDWDSESDWETVDEDCEDEVKTGIWKGTGGFAYTSYENMSRSFIDAHVRNEYLASQDLRSTNQ